MFQLSRKVLPGIFVILAMLLGAWTAPFKVSQQSGDPENHPNIPTKLDASQVVSNSGTLTLTGTLAKVQGAQERVDRLSSFQMDFSAVSPSNVSSLDKQFISDSLESNSLELWTMEYAVNKVKDPDLKNFIQMMIAMHSKDQQTSIALAKKLGMDTSVDFTNASVYPETPDYDLGMRSENYVNDYLDHLVEKAGVSFDDVVLHILDSEHTSDVQGEMAAERLTSNPAIKAFAKHSADVTELHLQFIDVLSAKISEKFDESPSPDFSQPYQSPFTITVNGQSH